MNIIEKLKLAMGIFRKAGSSGGETIWPMMVSPWNDKMPARWKDNPAEQVKHYKQWVFAAVNAIARAVAGARLRLYTEEKGKPKEITEHPFLDLIYSVNPLYTGTDLWHATIVFLGLTGNAYWYMPHTPLGIPGEIWILQSQKVKVIPSRKTLIAAYQYGSSTDKVNFAPEEITHFKYPNPVDPLYGKSPLQAAAEAQDSYEEMQTSRWRGFKQSVRPDTVATPKNNLTQDQLDRLSAQVNQNYGGSENAGKMLILPYPFESIKPFMVAPREMDYLRSARLTREEVLGIYGVPPSIAGIVENVNRAVAEAQEYVFSKYTVAPLLTMLAARITQDILNRFYDDRLYCEFDNPVPVDEERIAKINSIYVDVVKTRDEIRRELNLEPKGANELYTDMNKIPIGSSGAKSEREPRAYTPSLIQRGSSRSADALSDGEIRRMLDEDYCKAFDPKARELLKALQGFFEGQRKRVIKRLRAALSGKSYIKTSQSELRRLLKEIFPRKEEAGLMKEATDASLLASYIASAVREAELLDVPLDMGLYNERAGKWLEKVKSVDYWESDKAPNATTIKQIHSRLAQGMEAGESVSELAERIDGLYEQTYKGRALTIAKTETAGAFGEGAEELRREEGVEKKEWITTMDDMTRDDHAAANGQAVKVGRPFNIGGEDLMYPGDPSGSAEQICNCRCSSAGVVERKQIISYLQRRGYVHGNIS